MYGKVAMEYGDSVYLAEHCENPLSGIDPGESSDSCLQILVGWTSLKDSNGRADIDS